MSANGSRPGGAERRLAGDAVAARRRAALVSGMRGLARTGVAGAPFGRVPAPTDEDSEVERCDLCGVSIPDDHRHLIHLLERRIVCSCEGCWAMRSGDGDYRPTGARVLSLPGLDLPDELWASFQIPIGLAFFMQSTVTACVVAMYPSPAGATESELHFEAWSRLRERNPGLAELESDIEGLIVNRLATPPIYAIAPIDRCYALTGAVKLTWEGISGGTGVEHAVTRFFDDLLAEATVA
jgi:hypothetical protein